LTYSTTATANLGLPAVLAIHAAQRPDEAAVICGRNILDYATLSLRANELARHLRALGIGPESRVGVYLPRSEQRVIALLSILIVGGTYVPLDPAQPTVRSEFMLRETQPAVLITAAALPAIDAAGARVLHLDAAFEGTLALRVTTFAAPPTEAVAYIIFTSGSTGSPKGVAVAYGTLLQHCATIADHFGLAPGDRVLQFASPGFDVHLEQTLPTLFAGATVMVADDLWSPAELSRKIGELALTVINLPPVYLQELLRERETAAAASERETYLRLVIAGGEALPASVATAWQRTCSSVLLNAYGPTEATITATTFALASGDAQTGGGTATVPIGLPLPGRSAYVVGRDGRPVLRGEVGELHLGGHLARGYVGRASYTAERFVPDSFGGAEGARLYRTGDLVRVREDYVLEFIGRTDDQIKIRGVRIEPAEVEAVLLSERGIRQAVVLAREDEQGKRRLIAYLVADQDIDKAALRRAVATRLPEPMVPQSLVQLDNLPLTLNGKIDRGALPSPWQQAAQAITPLHATRTPGDETMLDGARSVEAAIATIWAEVLGIGQIAPSANFFELGGHSLLVIQVVARVRQRLGVEISLRAIFDHPTVEGLSKVLAEGVSATVVTYDGAAHRTGQE
jgi:amino acid adenylation domain-containing protein